MRDGFREIVNGWTLISGMGDLTDRIEAAAEWTKTNGPLEPDEQATIELMIKAQIARGMPGLIRQLGMEQEFGLPRDDDDDGAVDDFVENPWPC